ncbi:MAG: dihydrolipoyllysine-residue acetyltransferase [bacterium]
MANKSNIVVPDIGDFQGVEVIEVLVSEGDQLEVEQALITLETEKATMDVPVEVAGKLIELKVKAGDKVSEGDVIGVVEASTEQETQVESVEKAPKQPDRPETPVKKEVPKQPKAADQGHTHSASRVSPVAFDAERVLPDRAAYASPSIRAFARVLGVNVSQVNGTGRKGRILKEDVEAFVKSAMTGQSKPAQGGLGVAPMPRIDFARFGPVYSKELSRIQKISGANLHRNWVSIPHVTQHDEADITEMEAFRQSLKAEAARKEIKMTPLVFLIKACVAALKAYPQFNASLDADGEMLVFKQYYHIGVAVDTPNGLVVPVLRDCDKKGLWELAEELAEISLRAREGKMAPADMQGGCFSISSLGGIGGTAFTPIVNAPEVAILGVSRSKMAPVYQDGEFVPRLMLPLSLSYDHRVVDGAAAARFTSYLAQVLADLRRLLL